MAIGRLGLISPVVVSAMVADEDTPDEPERGEIPRRKKWPRWRRLRPRGGGESSGGIGVREPRRPRPGGDADAVELEPEETDG